MAEIKSDPRLEAWRLFITLHAKIVEIIDADIQAAGGIPLQHYDVLIELFEAEGKQLRMYELAQRVALSRSSITRFVDQLAQQEFLTRKTDPEDRRGSYAVLTKAESWPYYREAIQQHFGSFLADEEAVLMAQALERMHVAIDDRS